MNIYAPKWLSFVNTNEILGRTKTFVTFTFIILKKDEMKVNGEAVSP